MNLALICEKTLFSGKVIFFLCHAIFKSIKRILFNDKDLEHIQIFLKHNVTALIITQYHDTVS